MPPQGESSGFCIEDAVLLAHVFSRRETRTIESLFCDYERLRRDTVERLYKEATFRWGNGSKDIAWPRFLFFEWLTTLYVLSVNWKMENPLAQDVRKLPLPV